MELNQRNALKKQIFAYKLKHSNTVVTQQSMLANTEPDDYEKVNVIISHDEIMMLYDEIKLLQLSNMS